MQQLAASRTTHEEFPKHLVTSLAFPLTLHLSDDVLPKTADYCSFEATNCFYNTKQMMETMKKEITEDAVSTKTIAAALAIAAAQSQPQPQPKPQPPPQAGFIIIVCEFLNAGVKVFKAGRTGNFMKRMGSTPSKVLHLRSSRSPKRC